MRKTNKFAILPLMKKSSHFADRLVAAIEKKGAPICVGLDPRLSQIPKHIIDAKIQKKGRSFEAAAEAIVDFNKGIIDAVFDLVPAVKVQFACYLPYGFAGVWAFEETCKYAAEKKLIVIADGKFNDIGSTADFYASAFLGDVDLFGDRVETGFVCDAVTVNPYLGYDGIKPFLDVAKKNGKGIFILVKTSNVSSGDLQDQQITSQKIPIFELVARFVESWGCDLIGESGFSSVGVVVGATKPYEMKHLRSLMPNMIFLVPGYGTQGAGASEVKHAFTENGRGALINASRSIIYAWQAAENPKGFADSARQAVLKMKEELSALF